MFGSLFKTPAPVSVPVAVVHLVRLRVTGNVSATASTSTPHILQLKSLSIAATTSTTTGSQSQSSSSPISSSEYLVKSLGLPPESDSAHTITKAKGVELKSTKNADSVLALFKDFGFTPSHIATIFSKCPILLHLDAHRKLKPKLDFFTQNGIAGEALFDILTTNPHILRNSLHRTIKPCITFLNSFLGKEDSSSSQLSGGGTWILRYLSDSVSPNVQTLRDYGVPDSHILKMMRSNSGNFCLVLDVKRFSEAVREAKEMGFDPSSMMFLRAIYTLMGMKKEKLEAKFELVKSFGWTDEQVRALFLKQPDFFRASDERLKGALEFFMNKLNWTVRDVSTYPMALLCSFDKRILPRSSVLEILTSEGLLKKGSNGNAYLVSEDVFLRKFVENHREHIPQLLEIYQKKKAR